MAEPVKKQPNPEKSRKVPPSLYLITISLSLFSFSLFFLSFTDTKFWFLFTNAIIFFLAGADDSQAFSSTKLDLHDQFLKHRRTRLSDTSPHSRPMTVSGPDQDAELATVVEKKHASNFSRSETERAVVTVKEVTVLRRSDTGKVEGAEESDLSGVSDDELNRRVEEFINRINREFRLQEIRDR